MLRTLHDLIVVAPNLTTYLPAAYTVRYILVRAGLVLLPKSPASNMSTVMSLSLIMVGPPTMADRVEL